MLVFHGRQLAATIANGGLGFLVGLTLTPLIFGIIGGLCLQLWRHAMSAGAAAACLLFGLMAWFLSWRGVQSAARDAARRFPISLRAVPIGILIGAGIVGASMFASGLGSRNASLVITACSVLLGGGIEVLAAMKGSRLGVLERHGSPQPGVGEMCATCMYDMRGSPPGNACSECGGMMRYAVYVDP